MAKSATATRDDKAGAQPGKPVEKASKSIIKAASKAPSSAVSALGDNAVTGIFTRSIDFLNDVRSEMRKVVTPSWNEVRSMTTVVILTVFAFAAFFYVVDGILGHAVRALLHLLGGTQ